MSTWMFYIGFYQIPEDTSFEDTPVELISDNSFFIQTR